MNKLDCINGTLKTYENNCMSLSCSGEIEFKNNQIVSVHYKGMPRTDDRDSWLKYYKKAKIGDCFSPMQIKNILSYNGRDNIVSVFIPNKVEELEI